MKRDELEKAAKKYAGSERTAAENAELRDLGAFCWTSNEMIDFAIQQINAALEEAADLIEGWHESRTRGHMEKIETENFAVKLTDAAKTHEEWLAIVQFGLGTLLEDQPLLFEIMSREASKMVERDRVIGRVMSDALRQIFRELGLKLTVP